MPFQTRPKDRDVALQEGVVGALQPSPDQQPPIPSNQPSEQHNAKKRQTEPA
jgi:hypothetical protein